MIRLLPLLALLLTQPALAAESVYRIVHPNGTVEFTDEPRPGAERLEIPPVPTYSPPPAPATPPPAAAAARARPPARPSVAITAPAPGETFWVSDWQVPASVSVTRPPESEPLEVEMLVDGTPVARGSGPQLLLAPVYRGEHEVVARLLDADGEEQARSQPVTFFVQKHTINR